MFLELLFLSELLEPSAKVKKEKHEEELENRLNQLEIANNNLIASFISQGKSVEEAKEIADGINGEKIKEYKEELDSIYYEKEEKHRRNQSGNKKIFAFMIFIVLLALIYLFIRA